MLPVQVMETARHTADAFRRVNQNRFRRLETFLRLQFPTEIIRIKPYCHAHTVKLADFLLNHKITGIHKIHGIHFAGILRGPFRHQRHEGMFLMSWFPPQGRYRVFTVPRFLPLDTALPRPGTVQRQTFKVLIVHIKAGGKDFRQIDVLSRSFRPRRFI